MCVTIFLHMFAFKHRLKKKKARNKTAQTKILQPRNISTEYIEKTNYTLKG